MNPWIRVSNIIYTEPGPRQGFTFKEVTIYWFVFRRMFRVRIPFWILSYDKKQAQELHKTILHIREIKDE